MIKRTGEMLPVLIPFVEISIIFNTQTGGNHEPIPTHRKSD